MCGKINDFNMWHLEFVAILSRKSLHDLFSIIDLVKK